MPSANKGSNNSAVKTPSLSYALNAAAASHLATLLADPVLGALTTTAELDTVKWTSEAVRLIPIEVSIRAAQEDEDDDEVEDEVEEDEVKEEEDEVEDEEVIVFNKVRRVHACARSHVTLPFTRPGTAAAASITAGGRANRPLVIALMKRFPDMRLTDRESRQRYVRQAFALFGSWRVRDD